MTEQEKREKAIDEMRFIVDKYCTAIDDECGCEQNCFPCRGVLGELFEKGYRKEEEVQKETAQKIWHNFLKEKPQENKDYVTMVLFECGGVWMAVLPYYKEAMAFNWDGKGDDTKIEVQYWAEVEDVVESAIKNI